MTHIIERINKQYDNNKRRYDMTETTRNEGIFSICNRENGDMFEDNFKTIEEAETSIDEMETQDREEDNYIDNYYQVYNNETREYL